MSLEQQRSSSAAQETSEFNVAQELATAIGIYEGDITSYTAQNRRDYDGRLGQVNKSTESHDGALQVQVFFRGQDGQERDKLLMIDDERRHGLSEDAISFFGGIAASAPAVDCISFVDRKL